MIAGNYKGSTTGTGETTFSNTRDGTGSCDLVVYTEIPLLPEIQMPIKRKLTKQDKRRMFKIADQKHSRRPGK